MYLKRENKYFSHLRANKESLRVLRAFVVILPFFLFVFSSILSLLSTHELSTTSFLILFPFSFNLFPWFPSFPNQTLLYITEGNDSLNMLPRFPIFHTQIHRSFSVVGFYVIYYFLIYPCPNKIWVS